MTNSSNSHGKLSFRKSKTSGPREDANARGDDTDDHDNDTQADGTDAGPRRSGRRRLFKS
jgi:hypothetical protein